MDEVAVYGSALAAARVQAHYTAGRSGGGRHQLPTATIRHHRRDDMEGGRHVAFYGSASDPQEGPTHPTPDTLGRHDGQFRPLDWILRRELSDVACRSQLTSGSSGAYTSSRCPVRQRGVAPDPERHAAFSGGLTVAPTHTITANAPHHRARAGRGDELQRHRPPGLPARLLAPGRDLGDDGGRLERREPSGSYLASPSLNQPGALVGDTNRSVGFNGSSQYVNVPYLAALNPAQVTVEAWAYPTGGQGSFRSVVTSRDYATGNPRGYILYAASDNTWQFWLGTGTNEWDIVLGPAIVLNQWTHPLATFDGTTARLYVNGALRAPRERPTH